MNRWQDFDVEAELAKIRDVEALSAAGRRLQAQRQRKGEAVDDQPVWTHRARQHPTEPHAWLMEEIPPPAGVDHQQSSDAEFRAVLAAFGVHL